MQVTAINQLYEPNNANNRNNLCFRGTMLPKAKNLYDITDTFTKSNNFSEAYEVPKKYMQALKERFFKDFTISQVLDIRRRYQELMKISNVDEFLIKLCDEFKKDYGIENVPIRLNTDFESGYAYNDLSPQGKYRPDYANGFLEISINKNNPKEKLFCIMAHEFRHIFQDIKCYQHSTLTEYTDVLLERFKNVTSNSNFTDEEILDFYINPFVNNMNYFYINSGIEKLDRNEPSYKFGRKILSSKRAEMAMDASSYNASYYERDAMRTEIDLYNIVFQ